LKLAEPLETEQSEINRLVDKSKVKDFIDQQKKKSTVNCTKRDLNIVYKWLVSKNELRSIETILATELDTYLAEFFQGITFFSISI
jgi:site-specific recombinase XerD